MPEPPENAFARIIRFEGRVSQMYLDTRGNVTVGVGFLLGDAAAAERLPFLVKSTRTPASATQKRDEWAAVRSMPFGQAIPAASFESKTKLYLDTPAIDAELRERVEKFRAGLLSRFDGFDLLPPPAQEALLDMAFNLGLGRPARGGDPATGLAQYVNLADCVRRRDWAGAAAECHRRGISNERNEETRQLFLAARR